MPGTKTVYRTDPESGAVTTHDLSSVDAREAVRGHPDEWSFAHPKGQAVGYAGDTPAPEVTNDNPDAPPQPEPSPNPSASEEGTDPPAV
jgi:hypothetical protein